MSTLTIIGIIALVIIVLYLAIKYELLGALLQIFCAIGTGSDSDSSSGGSSGGDGFGGGDSGGGGSSGDW
jgi:uncharacterized protein